MRSFIKENTDLDTYEYGYLKNSVDELLLVNITTGEKVSIDKSQYDYPDL
jgi:hypothetical protein